MRSGDYVWPRVMHAGVNREGCSVQRMLAFHNFALGIYQHQVGDANLAEMYSERVHPKMIGLLRITRRDVPSHAFIETEFGEQSKRSGQAFLTMPPFFFHGCEFRGAWKCWILHGRGSHALNLTQPVSAAQYNTGDQSRLVLPA